MADAQSDTDIVEPEPLHGQSVLLVEDDTATAQMYKMQLQLDGYLVLTATDGESALSIAEKFEPDLVVVDIGLLGMNGLASPGRHAGQRSSPRHPRSDPHQSG
jgi:PleD family two-component response regulator